jgi:hypothetical protein
MAIDLVVAELRRRCMIAPADHRAELQWLDAATTTNSKLDWIEHWAATRIDVWRGVSATAIAMGDVLLSEQLAHEIASVERNPATLPHLSRSVSQVASYLGVRQRSASATRDLCWASVVMATSTRADLIADAHAVAKAALSELQSQAGLPLLLPYDVETTRWLTAPWQTIAVEPAVFDSVPLIDAVAIANSTITAHEGFMLWRSMCADDSATATVLDEILTFANDEGFPRCASVVAAGLDLKLQHSTQHDSFVASGHPLLRARIDTFKDDLQRCQSLTQIEVTLAKHHSLRIAESVWWESLAMIAFAPLVAALALDSERSDQHRRELAMACSVAAKIFGTWQAWQLLLAAPPLAFALQESFERLDDEANSRPRQWGELGFPGTPFAVKAHTLRRIGELAHHPLAPHGWTSAEHWIACVVSDCRDAWQLEDSADHVHLTVLGRSLTIEDIVNMRTSLA